MKLSIITINYNNLEGLKRTYESVVSQTCQDFEWIIIDGGSTDGSKEFIEEHQGQFAYWCSEPDKGVYNAMNKGIAKATGEYLNFMNSGDCFYDEHTLKNVFSQELVADLVYGDWIRVYPDHEEYKAAPPKAFYATVFFDNVCHQAMLIKSKVLKQRGYDDNMHILADWKRWIEMSLEGQTFQYIPLTICRFEATMGLSENVSEQHSRERERLYDLMPVEISRQIKKYNKLYLQNWEYNNNPIIYDTIRIASKGSSYKTKLIHINLSIIKILEKIFG